MFLQTCYAILFTSILGSDVRLQEKDDWYTANHTCTENLSGRLLSKIDVTMDPALRDITTPSSKSYWSNKMATITDFIQYDGCFNSSELHAQKQLVPPSRSPIAACFEYCNNMNTSRIGVTTKDMMNVSCICLGDEKLYRENISTCYIPCPNDFLNTCGSEDFISVYVRQHFGAQNPTEMSECVAITTDDNGISLSVDDCMKTNDGYICKICEEDKCSTKIFAGKEKITWQEAQQECEGHGGYLGNIGTSRNKTIWTGYKRWMLKEDYSVFSRLCLLCEYKNGTADCIYANCSEQHESLCVTESEQLQEVAWFDAERSCETSGSRLLTEKEFSEKVIGDNMFTSHSFWIYGVAEYSPCARSIGCCDISNTSNISSLSGVQNSVLKCMEFCKDTPYLGLTKENTTIDKCFCIEDIDTLSAIFTNASECAMNCHEEYTDLCGGHDRLIVYEIDRKSVAEGMYETSVECMYLIKHQDYMNMRSADCLIDATGYICETCETGKENCTQAAYPGELNWYEADEECREIGGNLGNMEFSDYSSLKDGTYWYGNRRWLKEEDPRGAKQSETEACLSCRSKNGSPDCVYKYCSENLQALCTEVNSTEPTTHEITTVHTVHKLMTTIKYYTKSAGSSGTLIFVPTQSSDQHDQGKAKFQNEHDDFNSNVIAVIVALLVICGVVVMLVITKLRKNEKVTSDVTDLIDTKNGPTKISFLKENDSRPSSLSHVTVERQRSFSNPSFMDHDVDILAKSLDNETTHQDHDQTN
ncbi:uncharacterized protein LOC133183657 [Saccostrea echinata]|uniref:uncharacterized protein LOC133183657 n=1 Tax=Saccostrea echinata TaxID=191078 RepID=UPI002A83F01C|nr:uncharacterized protein LOC133183657 [Saccostrea echinata]